MIFGGRSGGVFFNDVWLLDIRTWTFRVVDARVSPNGTVPAPRAGHCAIRVGHVLYTFGGFEIQRVYPDTPKTQLTVLHNDVHMLDVMNTTWRKVTPSIPHPRTRSRLVYLCKTPSNPFNVTIAACFYYEGKLYVHGGGDIRKAYSTFKALPLSGDLFSSSENIRYPSLRYLVAQYMVDHNILTIVPPHLRSVVDRLFFSMPRSLKSKPQKK